MQRRTPLIIICSSRPRVGKTLLARVMVEFFRCDERPVMAFDVNPDEFDLVEYLPGYTAVASIADTRGQIALFDDLLAANQVPKVVDLGHSLFDRFFSIVEQIGFMEEAKRRGIAPLIVFIPDPDRRSRQGYASLQPRFPRVPLVSVVNEALPSLGRNRDPFPFTPGAGATLTLRTLSPVLKGVIERPSFSFAAFAITGDTTTELHRWTRRAFLQFRELELRLLLSELGPALKFSA